MSASDRTFRFLWLVLALVVLLIVVGPAYLCFWPQVIEVRIRQSVTKALEERFQSKAELPDLQIKLFPRVSVVGRNLALHSSLPGQSWLHLLGQGSAARPEMSQERWLVSESPSMKPNVTKVTCERMVFCFPCIAIRPGELVSRRKS
jgi:hypothetical protein